MINYGAYRKFVTLQNGKRVMFRFLNEQDGEELIRLFQEAPDEDLRFLKQDVKDAKLVGSWVEHLNYQKVLPLVAVNLEGNQLIADATKNLFIHVRAIRKATISQDNRAARSIIDHLKIIEALERRDTELAERWRRAVAVKLPGHGINDPSFLQPDRPMSAIGG